MSAPNILESYYKICNSSHENLEIFHVKLTDSALKHIEHLYRKQKKTIRLDVNGDHGTMTLADKHKCVDYDLSLSCVQNSPDGLIDYMQIQGSRVISIGKPLTRITVQANDESFSAAKIKMSEAENEQRKCQVKGLTNRTKMNNPASSLECSMKPRSSQNTSPSEIKISPSITNCRSYSPLRTNQNISPLTRNQIVTERRLRDRVIHLLVLRPYRRVELLSRLKKDGLTDCEKGQLDDVLHKISRLNKHGEHFLNSALVSLVDPSWPGYSATERTSAASIKAKLQSSSPGNKLSTDLHLPNSPAANSVIAAEDFGRKPTRASAPTAPHSLNKKIAALDLLSSGLPEASVATRQGISVQLLEQWKHNELDLRQRYAQRQGLAVPKENLITAIQPSAMAADVPQAKSHKLKSADSSSGVTESKRYKVDSLKDASDLPNIPRISDEASSHLLLSNLSVNVPDKNPPPFRRLPQKPASPEQLCSEPSPVEEDCITKQNLCSTSDASSASLPSRTIPNCLPSGCASMPFCDQVTGSGSDSAYYTTPTNIVTHGGGVGGFNSGGSSINCSAGGLVRGSMMDIDSRSVRRRPLRDFGSETSSCDDSSVPSPETPPNTIAAGPSHQNLGKPSRHVYPTAQCREEKSSELSDEDCLYSDIAMETAEIDSLFPKIESPPQASAYRKEFENLYPSYLRLYHSFQTAWETVDRLKRRVLSALRDNDSSASLLACELDDFIKGMRSPTRRTNEIQLAVMTYKLRLLKQRLTNFATIRMNATQRIPPDDA